MRNTSRYLGIPFQETEVYLFLIGKILLRFIIKKYLIFLKIAIKERFPLFIRQNCNIQIDKKVSQR